MLKKIKEFIINIFLPKRCIYCGKILDYNALLSICKKCVIPALAKEKPRRDFIEKYFDAVLCATYYEKHIRYAMIKFKFKSITSLADTFSHMMLIKVKEDWRFLTSDIITSVPLSDKRLKERGYNQSHLLAKNLAPKLDMPYNEKLLVKVKDIPRISKLTLSQRRKIVRGVYKFDNNFDIRGKKIILIDDIFTTGSTANECARILKKNGAQSVFVLTACETRQKTDIIEEKSKEDFYIKDL
ncbi:MAG: ComF family protein [Ruminococcaceae bacterium]|nr:ComF family protein [Oscillospiraceae bacterium]